MNDYTLELWTTWKETLDNDGLDTFASEASSMHQIISCSINLTSISEVAQVYRGKKSSIYMEGIYKPCTLKLDTLFWKFTLTFILIKLSKTAGSA